MINKMLSSIQKIQEKYDLIILDLRLDDEVSGSSEDVLGIENLSGIKLLKK